MRQGSTWQHDCTPFCRGARSGPPTLDLRETIFDEMAPLEGVGIIVPPLCAVGVVRTSRIGGVLAARSDGLQPVKIGRFPNARRVAPADTPDPGGHCPVPARPIRRPRRVGPPWKAIMRRGRGDRQNVADRLDCVVPRWPSMTSTSTSAGGRTPPSQSKQMPCAGTRLPGAIRAAPAHVPPSSWSSRRGIPARQPRTTSAFGALSFSLWGVRPIIAATDTAPPASATDVGPWG